MTTIVMELGGVVPPALQAIATRAARADAQGALQGVFASLNAIVMITSPLIMTGTFAHFSTADAQVHAPGAPFLLAALLMRAWIGLQATVENSNSAIRGRNPP